MITVILKYTENYKMFGLFKSKKQKLEDTYKKLLEESYKLSTIDRAKSDLKAAEAAEVLKKIESLKPQK